MGDNNQFGGHTLEVLSIECNGVGACNNMDVLLGHNTILHEFICNPGECDFCKVRTDPADPGMSCYVMAIKDSSIRPRFAFLVYPRKLRVLRGMHLPRAMRVIFSVYSLISHSVSIQSGSIHFHFVLYLLDFHFICYFVISVYTVCRFAN